MRSVRLYKERYPLVEAIRYLPGTNCDVIAEWMGAPHNCEDCSAQTPWEFENPDGYMAADPGDWIVRDGFGNFWALKPAMFEREYEPA